LDCVTFDLVNFSLHNIHHHCSFLLYNIICSFFCFLELNEAGNMNRSDCSISAFCFEPLVIEVVMLHKGRRCQPSSSLITTWDSLIIGGRLFRFQEYIIIIYLRRFYDIFLIQNNTSINTIIRNKGYYMHKFSSVHIPNPRKCW